MAVLTEAIKNSDSLEFFKLKIEIGNLNIYPGYVELFGAFWFHLTLLSLSLTFVEFKFTKRCFGGSVDKLLEWSLSSVFHLSVVIAQSY